MLRRRRRKRDRELIESAGLAVEHVPAEPVPSASENGHREPPEQAVPERAETVELEP